MKRFMIMLTLLLFVFGCGNEKTPNAKVDAQNIKNMKGWYKAQWGMTESEILETFKGQAVRLSKPRDHGKYVATVEIPKIETADMTLSVSFLMHKDSLKLARVQLQPINLGPGWIAHFSHLEEVLTKKYGPPLYKDEKERNSYMVIWQFPDTSIELSGMSSAGFYTGLVIINYCPNIPDDSKYL